jgi:uncharacterized protein YwgA
MINLTTEEKSEILNLSRDFVEIHQEIIVVEKEIKRLEELSSELIAKLEDCRERECNFTQSLSYRYGDGSLDAINLAWKKEELVNEVL